MSVSNSGRGRPPKDPAKRKSVPCTVKLRPSHKKIIRQESDLCDAPMAKIFRLHAFEEIKPQGLDLPSPTVFMEIASLAEELYETAMSEDAKWLTVEAIGIQTELNRKKLKLQGADEKRDRLRLQSARETLAPNLTVPMTQRRKEWLERYADAEDAALTTFFREKAFEGLRRRTKLARGGIWIDRWTDLLDPITDRRFERHEEKTRKEMKQIAKDIHDRIQTDVIGDRSPR